MVLSSDFVSTWTILKGSSRSVASKVTRACHFEQWIDDFISGPDVAFLARGKKIDGDPSTEALVKKELEDFEKWRNDFISGA
jgi:hypothetical protein